MAAMPRVCYSAGPFVASVAHSAQVSPRHNKEVKKKKVI